MPIPDQRLEDRIPACQLRSAEHTTARTVLMLVGINHQTSALNEREPLQLGRDELPLVDNLLLTVAGMREAAAVCTCNRIEFYLVLRDTVDPFAAVAEMYRSHRAINLRPLREKFYVRSEGNAVRHLLHVAAGLNSMVLGETQIFGQIKQGYSQACAVKSVGKILHRLFHQAFRTGKKVREETAIGQGAVSIGGVAARLVRERLVGLPNPGILFVGVNEMISLAAEHLSGDGFRRFSFVNRTPAHAEKLAAVFGTTCRPLPELGRLLAEADVLVCCTGAGTPLITATLVRDAMAGGKKEKLLIVDLGVPRDVEPEVDRVPGVTVIDLEVMNRELNARLEERAVAIKPAEDIVEQKLAEFMYWYEAVRQEPLYNGLADSFEQIQSEELAAAGERCPPEIRRALEQFSGRLMRRLWQAVSRRSE